MNIAIIVLIKSHRKISTAAAYLLTFFSLDELAEK